MRRLALAILVATLAVAPPPTGAVGQGAYTEIRGVLERRAVAMLAGDEAAFMSTVHRGDPSFVDRQRLLFRGFQQLPLDEYHLGFDEGGPVELTTEREVDEYGPAFDPTVLHVIERYRLAGYDAAPAVEDLFLTFVHVDGSWRVASDTDLDDVTLFSGRKLWELGPIVTRESDHFLYVSHPALAEAASEILSAAESALATVVERWPVPWSERVVLLAPSTTEELSRLIQATFDLDVFVAFAYSGVDRTDGWRLSGSRVILNWPNFSTYPADVRRRILVHELSHAATRGYSGPFVSAFVDEAMADWVAGNVRTDLLSAKVAAGTFDEELPRDYEFVAGDDSDILTAYEEAGTAAQFAVETFGVDALAAFYRRVGRPRVAPGTPRYHVDLAAREAFGIGIEAFERRWADWVERTL